MKTTAYVITIGSLCATTLMSSLEPTLKTITMVLILVISTIANLLYIIEKFRDPIVRYFVQAAKEELIRLDYLKHESSDGKVSSVDKAKK